MYDLIIIGGGPAGAASAVYAARKKMKTLMITESIGGQSVVSDDIQNWIGEPHISGIDLAKKFEEHILSYPELEIKKPELVEKVEAVNCTGDVCDFRVTTKSGESYESKAVMLAAGARRRRLGVPGEDEFDGKGVAFCSTCDAPLFAGKKVAVIGGGNAGLEAVQDLFSYASEIYLLQRSGALKGDKATQEEIQKNPKLKEVLLYASTTKIYGDKFVTGLTYKNTQTGEEHELAVDGIFVEIGSVPNSEIVNGLVDMDEYKQVIIDAKHGTTSRPGIFAAGDITDDPYKQNNVSAGDAVKATLAAYAYVLKRNSAAK